MNVLTPTVDISAIKPKNPVWEMRNKIHNMCDITRLKYKATGSGISANKQSKQGIYNGIEFDSYWEFAFYLYWTRIMGCNVTRNTIKCFPYVKEKGGKSRFFPDFEVNGSFYEVKGIYRERDLLKKNATIGQVEFWGPDIMKDVIKQVNERIPKWRDLYFENTHLTKLGKK